MCKLHRVCFLTNDYFVYLMAFIVNYFGGKLKYNSLLLSGRKSFMFTWALAEPKSRLTCRAVISRTTRRHILLRHNASVFLPSLSLCLSCSHLHSTCAQPCCVCECIFTTWFMCQSNVNVTPQKTYWRNHRQVDVGVKADVVWKCPRKGGGGCEYPRVILQFKRFIISSELAQSAVYFVAARQFVIGFCLLVKWAKTHVEVG